ncbi:MAG: beta strand repeat-containing protein, partial [Pseudomonadota bacterium]
LTTVNLDTGPDESGNDLSTNTGGGNDVLTGTELSVQTITYDSEVALSTANLNASGANDITIKGIDVSDPDFNAFSLDVSSLAPGTTLLVTGGSPALEFGENGEQFNFDNNGEEVDPYEPPFGELGEGGEGEILLPPELEFPEQGETVYFGYEYDEVADEYILHEDDQGNYYAGVYGEELSFINLNGTGGAHDVHLGVLADIDGTDDYDDENNFLNDAFHLQGVDPTNPTRTTAILGEGNVNGNIVAPELEAGSTWRFDDAQITLTDTAILQDDSNLVMDDGILVIDGDVDLSAVNIDMEDSYIKVEEGSSLTLTTNQLSQLATNNTPIYGSGTTRVIDDPSGDPPAPNGDDLTPFFLDYVASVGVDLSGVTLTAADADQRLNVNVLLAADDDGVFVGHDITGSDFDDEMYLDPWLGPFDHTVTGGPGDDEYILGIGDDTFVVDEGTDTIRNLGFGGDDLIVSAGAEAVAYVDNPGYEFTATSDTVNDGTATLNAASSDSLIDVSAAGGSNGFVINGNIGADELIGSDQDDVINGGGNTPGGINAGEEDELTGNGGADLFQFDIQVGDPADLASTETTAPLDEETVSVNTGAGSSSDDFTINVNYEFNGVGQNLQISSGDIAGDVSDSNVIAGAVASALDSLNGLSAGASGDVVTVSGDDGNSFAFTGSEVSATATSGTAPTFNAAADGTDTAQESEVSITGTVNAGDIYSVLVTLANGQNIGAEYEAGASDGLAEVVAGLADAFNAVAPGSTVRADYDGNTDYSDGDPISGTATVFQLVDEEDDNGGFSILLGEQGSIDGTGASSLLTNPANQGSLGDADADTITDFTTSEDTISLGLDAGTFGNYFEDSGQSNWTDAFNEANNQFDGATIYYLTSTPSEEGLLFFDANADGEADGVVQLTGVDNTSFDYTDIVA